MTTKEDLREYQRILRWACPEVIKATAKRNRERYPDEISARKKACYAKNKKQYYETARAWVLRNPELVKQYRKNWTKKNPDLAKAGTLKRRALLKNADVYDCRDRIKDVRSQKECVYCHREIIGPTHVDHVIPLSRGGAHEPSNLVASCLSCNSKKSNRLLHEWKPCEWMKEAV